MIDCHRHVVSPDQDRYPLKSAFSDDSAQAQVATCGADLLLAEQGDCEGDGAVQQERVQILSGNTCRLLQFAMPSQAGDNANGS